jgi:muramidase (phage lysozyme)
MPKFQNRLAYVKGVVVYSLKSKVQEMHNIAPGSFITINDEELAMSSGFQALVSAGNFVDVSAQPAKIAVAIETRGNPDPIEDTSPIDEDEKGELVHE